MECEINIEKKIEDANVDIKKIGDMEIMRVEGKRLENEINDSIALYLAYFNDYISYCNRSICTCEPFPKKKLLICPTFVDHKLQALQKINIEDDSTKKMPTIPSDVAILKKLLSENKYIYKCDNFLACEPSEKGVAYMKESGRLPAWLKKKYQSAADILSFDEVYEYWENLLRISCSSSDNISGKTRALLPPKLVEDFNLIKKKYQDSYRSDLEYINIEKSKNAEFRKNLELKIADEYNSICNNINALNKSIEEHNKYVDLINGKNYNQENISAVFQFLLNNILKISYYSIRHSVGYNSDTKTLIVESVLPRLASLVKTKRVKFISATSCLKSTLFSKKERDHLYEDIIYKICLKSLFDVFCYDTANIVDAAVYNGTVCSFDKATGKKISPTIISVYVTKKFVDEVDLSKVDAKSCFKYLKGVSANKITLSMPIVPILALDKDDPRFVQGDEIVGRIDESSNIAEMDWKDFEHLIRELFEWEFNSTGGEVKVTQASRDGGVDAVVFDPDPIRGGKIVVQAKRYTKTVDVSSVRDLYGTVLNEGATKGVIITTSDYGPDAYDFAKGKPLTLLNGGHLLHLLSKHGRKARIDINEARVNLGLTQREK